MEEVKYPGSTEVYDNMLDLGSIPQTQSGILSSDFLQIQAASGYKESDSAPISFTIPATSSVYTQLSASYVYFRVKIVNNDSDGSKLAATDTVGPCENWFGSLIDNCVILLNDCPVSRNQGGLYSYKHYFTNLFCASPSVQTSYLSTELWYPDSNKTFTSTNSQFLLRRKFTAESKFVELIGKLHDGIMTTKVIPDFVTTQIHLRRKNASFALNADEVKETTPFNYKIVIEQATFFAKRILINPKILQMHHQLLNSGKKFHYALKNLDIKTFQIPSGSIDADSSILWTGKLPSYIIICLVSAASYNGNLKSSPYSFQRHDLQQLCLTVDGSMSNLYRQIDFNDGLYLLGYDSLRSVIPYPQLGHGIDRNAYLDSNKFIVAIELQPSHYDNRFQLQGNHQVKVQFRFKSATSESINAICCGMLESHLYIDRESIYSDALAI